MNKFDGLRKGNPQNSHQFRAGAGAEGGDLYWYIYIPPPDYLVKVWVGPSADVCVWVVEHANRKTVTSLDVVYALKHTGRTLYVSFFVVISWGRGGERGVY